MSSEDTIVYAVMCKDEELQWNIPYAYEEGVARWYIDFSYMGKNNKCDIIKVKEKHLMQLGEKIGRAPILIEPYGDIYITSADAECIQECIDSDAELLTKTCKQLKKLLRVCKGKSAKELTKALKAFMTDTSGTEIEDYEIDEYDTEQLIYSKIDFEKYAKRYMKYIYDTSK